MLNTADLASAKAPSPRVIHVRLAQRLRGRAWLARLRPPTPECYRHYKNIPPTKAVSWTLDVLSESLGLPLPNHHHTLYQTHDHYMWREFVCRGEYAWNSDLSCCVAEIRFLPLRAYEFDVEAFLIFYIILPNIEIYSSVRSQSRSFLKSLFCVCIEFAAILM